MVKFLPHYAPLFDKFRHKVLFSGRSSGKSYHVAIAAIWYCRNVRNMRIMYLREFGSSNDDSTRAQVIAVINDMGIENEWKLTNKYIIHKKTKARILFKGLERNTNNLKSIPDVDLAIVEECENTSKEAMNILIPGIRKPNSQIWWCGNPKDRLNAVAQKFIENGTTPNTIIITNDYRDNIYLSQDAIDEADELRLKFPDLYNWTYLGEYLDISNMVMVKNVVRKEIAAADSDLVCVGVDIALDGGDRTVIYVRKGRTRLALLIYNTMDIEPLVHILQDVIHKYKPDIMNIDSTGSGSWCPKALAAYDLHVTSINFSSASREPKKYSNMRTEMYGLAREYFANGGAILPQDIELERELNASYYTLDHKNRMALIPKKEIKKRTSGRSPDISDAFCLSLIVNGDMFRSTKAHDQAVAQRLSMDLVMAGSM